MENLFSESFSKHGVYDGETIETPQDEHGRFFRATIIVDESGMGAPWEEHDGHGDVRKVSSLRDCSKAPGEVILYRGGWNEYSFLYDWQGAIKKAKDEGWGCSDGQREGETAKQYRARAVQQDFDYLRGYCNDNWTWVGIRIDMLQELDGKEIETAPHLASLWGMESTNAGDYLTETANELLAEAKEHEDAKRIITLEEVE